MKQTLSLVILTHNSAEMLKPHLAEYANEVDQIVFIDNNSTDDIAGVAKKFNAQLFTRSLNNDFSAQRNSAFAHITSQWTFYIDSDEYVPPELWSEIHRLIESGEFEALSVPRRDFFLGKLLKYGETGHTSLLRLAKTSLGKNRWQRAVHEVWEVPTVNIGTLHSALQHSPHPTISEFLQKLHWYASLEPQSREKYSKIQILFEIAVYPPAKFIQNFFMKQGWRDGVIGCVHALLMSYYSLITRVYLYEAWHA